MKRYLTFFKTALFLLLLSSCITLKSFGVVAQATPELNTIKYTMNIKDTYNLNVYNVPCGYSVTWKSSNGNVVSVNSKGKLKAKSVGDAKITCILKKATKNIKIICNVKVVESSKVVKVVHNYKELSNAIDSKVNKILLSTEQSLKFQIPDKDLSNTVLEIDAPKSSIVNSAKFKQIIINDIQPAGWMECSSAGNDILVNTDKLILKTTSESIIDNIEFNTKNLRFENNGVVKNATVDSNCSIAIVNNGSMESLKVFGEKIEVDYSGLTENMVNIEVLENSNNSKIHLYSLANFTLGEVKNFTINNYTQEPLSISKGDEMFQLTAKSTYTF